MVYKQLFFIHNMLASVVTEVLKICASRVQMEEDLTEMNMRRPPTALVNEREDNH